ncbi:bifunctional diaminohydroxyphosphoribosylaminopyrimidine deaminase/5-amino-6-(5-phosphoribosylamino)uracil reductase RibD [Paenibacillus sp. UMB4589-SE434]|uniref:bifunctional diaminohydroxyphosphoribosylaminopyrimidine deaminase/5-amino-6-(5-phosphoribosylamino)uracil reductase RibD n=1 Tax=Paenibacillus sp. UMB4589-SE434 TaxID=3046314 RepID=UPI0025505280|nr:bifunctional diaminohydroxyphosphoribosylaminopyrimidine deaminase/5-amino-6-(5-phosphoribosylamino)uracil reductase RibD [Paenibacillus sp. UMB4589-SE434]MDK8179426.1 bifunctional diaminohydroxyphosphoribosylaminopyrimidine deaminase/5-amino-6-(5-phosphoribosylamino)uracil reductase RibD [Paenibacillus sp. UMB4589-SE434]
MHTVINDEFYMKLAIELAERVIGQTGINPAVGCVIVNDGQIVGMGAHLRRGEGHAEVHALQMAGSRAEGGTAYVTLEPCSHFGKTPPCSLRLMEAGVKRVVVACTDPNPVVAGSGLTLLRQQAIEVKVGVLALEAYRIIEKFAKYITTGLPYVTLKTAQTLDGKIATHEGHSQWITNEQAREVVHTLRHRHQAIMVGIGTVLQDDPSLTTRLSVQGLNPIRMIVDSKLRLPLNAKVVSDKSAQTWVLTTITADQDRAAALERNGVTVIRINEGDRVDVRKAIEACGQREISSILLEGGGHLNGSMLEAGLIDQVVLMIAPKIVGHKDAPGSFIFPGPAKMSDAYCLEQISVETLGDNVIISGLPVRQEQEGREE